MVKPILGPKCCCVCKCRLTATIDAGNEGPCSVIANVSLNRCAEHFDAETYGVMMRVTGPGGVVYEGPAMVREFAGSYPDTFIVEGWVAVGAEIPVTDCVEPLPTEAMPATNSYTVPESCEVDCPESCPEINLSATSAQATVTGFSPEVVVVGKFPGNAFGPGSGNGTYDPVYETVTTRFIDWDVLNHAHVTGVNIYNILGDSPEFCPGQNLDCSIQYLGEATIEKQVDWAYGSSGTATATYEFWSMFGFYDIVDGIPSPVAPGCVVNGRSFSIFRRLKSQVNFTGEWTPAYVGIGGTILVDTPYSTGISYNATLDKYFYNVNAVEFVRGLAGDPVGVVDKSVNQFNADLVSDPWVLCNINAPGEACLFWDDCFILHRNVGFEIEYPHSPCVICTDCPPYILTNAGVDCADGSVLAVYKDQTRYRNWVLDNTNSPNYAYRSGPQVDFELL